MSQSAPLSEQPSTFGSPCALKYSGWLRKFSALQHFFGSKYPEKVGSKT
jgi:hypothetical protein